MFDSWVSDSQIMIWGLDSTSLFFVDLKEIIEDFANFAYSSGVSDEKIDTTVLFCTLKYQVKTVQQHG